MAFRAIPALPHPGFVTGRYYTRVYGETGTTLLLTENRLYYMPIFIHRAQAFDRLGFAITTGAGNSANEVRTGIYRSGTGVPGSLLVDNGRTVIGTGTGGTTVTIAQTLSPGWYWLSLIANRATGSATQPTLRAYANGMRNTALELLGSSQADLATESMVGIFNDQTVADWTTYTLPATAAVTYATAQAFPILTLRAA